MKTIIRINGLPFFEINRDIKAHLEDKMKIMGVEYVVIGELTSSNRIELTCTSAAEYERVFK